MLPVNARERLCDPTCSMFLKTVNYIKRGSSFLTENWNDILFACCRLYLSVCAMSHRTDLIDPARLPSHVR